MIRKWPKTGLGLRPKERPRFVAEVTYGSGVDPFSEPDRA